MPLIFKYSYTKSNLLLKCKQILSVATLGSEIFMSVTHFWLVRVLFNWRVTADSGDPGNAGAAHRGSACLPRAGQLAAASVRPPSSTSPETPGSGVLKERK